MMTATAAETTNHSYLLYIKNKNKNKTLSYSWAEWAQPKASPDTAFLVIVFTFIGY